MSHVHHTIARVAISTEFVNGNDHRGWPHEKVFHRSSVVRSACAPGWNGLWRGAWFTSFSRKRGNDYFNANRIRRRRKNIVLTRKKTLLLYLAVESALHKPKSETSCCVSYFYFALAIQFTSFIDKAKLLLFRDYFFARLLFPERGPWHQSDSQLIQTERFRTKFTYEGFHLLNIWHWKAD